MDKKELQQEIQRLKREKNAVILGHYYLRDEIQEVSDYIGDSLALAQRAQRCENDIIVFCGVHFMAETAKILNPSRRVLLPDLAATCSLAECCPAEEFARFKAQHPDHQVISYVNCSAEIKALSDLICTSGNAVQLVRSLPEEAKIIFAPDKNLGGYINRVTGRQMVLWDGSCMVHDAMRAESVRRLRREHPCAEVVAHPECRAEVLAEADFVGSTQAMLSHLRQLAKREVIVATEAGILYEMRRENPDKEFYVVPMGGCGGCAECGYMKQNTLEGLYGCLRDERPEIALDSETLARAAKPIERMLEMSRQLGLIK